jgi:hypothetical protein
MQHSLICVCWWWPGEPPAFTLPLIDGWWLASHELLTVLLVPVPVLGWHCSAAAALVTALAVLGSCGLMILDCSRLLRHSQQGATAAAAAAEAVAATVHVVSEHTLFDHHVTVQLSPCLTSNVQCAKQVEIPVFVAEALGPQTTSIHTQKQAAGGKGGSPGDHPWAAAGSTCTALWEQFMAAWFGSNGFVAPMVSVSNGFEQLLQFLFFSPGARVRGGRVPKALCHPLSNVECSV